MQESKEGVHLLLPPWLSCTTLRVLLFCLDNIRLSFVCSGTHPLCAVDPHDRYLCTCTHARSLAHCLTRSLRCMHARTHTRWRKACTHVSAHPHMRAHTYAAHAHSPILPRSLDHILRTCLRAHTRTLPRTHARTHGNRRSYTRLPARRPACQPTHVHTRTHICAHSAIADAHMHVLLTPPQAHGP